MDSIEEQTGNEYDKAKRCVMFLGRGFGLENDVNRKKYVHTSSIVLRVECEAFFTIWAKRGIASSNKLTFHDG